MSKLITAAMLLAVLALAACTTTDDSLDGWDVNTYAADGTPTPLMPLKALQP